MKFYYTDLRNFLRLVLVLLSIGFLSYIVLPQYYFKPKPACQNVDAVLSEETMESADYQNRVLEILNDSKPEDFRYFFKTFINKDQTIYLVVNMRNAEYCFDVKMLVSNCERLKGMYRTNGKGYPAELFDLTWKLNFPEVIFLDMYPIMD